MVQRYEQTRKLQWYKRGAAYIFSPETPINTGVLEVKGKNSPFTTHLHP